MNLGVLLNIGESLATLKASGQDKRLVDYYLKKYTKKFNKIYLFSYDKEKYKLPKNSFLIANHFSFHRFLYTFLMPVLHFREFKKCDVFRVTHLLGSIPVILAKVFYGKKFLVTYGYDYKEFARVEGKGFLRPLISCIEFLNFKLADGIIVTNKHIHDYVLRKINKDKVFYIPNGVDVRLFKPRSGIRNQESGIRTILFVGRLEKQKNLFTLIKAISLLKNRSEVLLRFVGDGSLRNDLRESAEKLKVNLEIIRKIVYDKMSLTYQGADIFVLPSLIEGHPKALLEALSCGLVCIVNKTKGTQGIIKDGKNGLFFAGRVEDLTEKIKTVLYDKKKRELERLRANARQLILEKYNLSKLLEKEINLLKSI